jgi:hypothetical protein
MDSCSMSVGMGAKNATVCAILCRNKYESNIAETFHVSLTQIKHMLWCLCIRENLLFRNHTNDE